MVLEEVGVGDKGARAHVAHEYSLASKPNDKAVMKTFTDTGHVGKQLLNMNLLPKLQPTRNIHLANFPNPS
jgi:hypothetical protein